MLSKINNIIDDHEIKMISSIIIIFTTVYQASLTNCITIGGAVRVSGKLKACSGGIRPKTPILEVCFSQYYIQPTVSLHWLMSCRHQLLLEPGINFLAMPM